MRVLFAGTPLFAVPTLEALVASTHQVAGVLTMPDRPRGRGRTPSPSPIKEIALREKLPLYQPEKFKRSEMEEELRDLAVDVVVVIAFGRILRSWFLELPRLGCVNVHASLLPLYRGPGPIEKSILDGNRETGITTMMIDEGVDTGDMLLVEKIAIGDAETAGELASRLAKRGAGLLMETLERLDRGDCPRTPQDHSRATHAPMLEKKDGRVDWGRRAAEIVCLVRAMNPRPVAWTPSIRGDMRIYRACEVVGLSTGGRPGEVIAADSRQGLIIAAGEGAVRLQEIQLPGRKRMDDRALLAGAAFTPGVLLAGGD